MSQVSRSRCARRGVVPAVLSALLLVCVGLRAAADGVVIPIPASVVAQQGFFSLDARTRIRVPAHDAEARAAADRLVELLAKTAGLHPAIVTRSTLDGIAFERIRGLGAEAYRLSVNPQGVTVSATTGAGLFYGAMTLWQLATPASGPTRIPAQRIEDQPTYRWRGLLLDSVRHFQSPTFIEKMIDWMAWHKLNVLHWHLTDDQGWRLQIRAYPRLTTVGAWRTPAVVPGTDAAAAEPSRYGGFYTKTEVREIVAFAATRHVLIVPEIDVPGHAQAAIAAYPSLGVGDAPLAVSSNWGVHRHVFNLEPQTFAFLENVLDEVMRLFPGPYVHLGGDEAVKDEWNQSPAVQRRAVALGLHGGDAIQNYFMQRLGGYLAAHGKRLIGWDEILQPGLQPEAIVMSWRGTAGARAAALSGRDAILSPQPTLYFDNRQSSLPQEPPGRLQVVSLADVYDFDPVDPSLSHAQQAHILGVQANLWTEHIQTEQRLQWMALPRAAAVAELGWSPAARRSWPDFLGRLVPMMARYRSAGVRYADSVFAVDAAITRDADAAVLRLSNQARSGSTPVGEIRYTTDGNEPSSGSPAYTEPVRVPLDTLVRAASFVGSARVSEVWQRRLDARSFARKDSHALELCTMAIGLLLQPDSPAAGNQEPIAVDIMNPCWIDRGVDLTHGATLTAGVVPLPFNYELGADADQVRLGEARTSDGELEIHVDGCKTPAAAVLPLGPAARSRAITTLPSQVLPAQAGRHDLCFRFARPRLDPQWALDWIELGE